MAKKMTQKDIDKLNKKFNSMSRETADKMSAQMGVQKTKKSTKKKK